MSQMLRINYRDFYDVPRIFFVKYEDKMYLFDSKFDDYKGVMAYIRIVNGELQSDDKVKFLGTGAEANVTEVGFFAPALSKSDKLSQGEIGYIATNQS